MGREQFLVSDYSDYLQKHYLPKNSTWVFVDCKHSHFSCWQHELPPTFLILGNTWPATFCCFFSASSFLTLLLYWWEVSWNLARDPCPSQEFSLHAFLFPLVLYTVDYTLLISLDSEVPILSSANRQTWPGHCQPARQAVMPPSRRDLGHHSDSLIRFLPHLIADGWKSLLDTFYVIFLVVLDARIDLIPVILSWLKRGPI